MAMTVDDQVPHVGLSWENQSWGLSNSDNSGENNKEKLIMKPTNQKEGNEGEALVNKKRSRGLASASGEKNIITSGEGKDGKCRESDHEMHIWTERERRKRMRNMFAGLHALLPQLPPKADKTTIVDEAVSYIRNLQQTLEKLEKQKRDRLQSVSPLGCESAVINSQWHPYDSKEAFTVDKGSSNNLSTEIGPSNPSNTSLTPGKPVAFQTWSSPNVVLNMCGSEAQFCICAPKKPGLLTTIAFVLEKYKIDVISANILCNGNRNMYMILAHAKRASHQFQDPKAMGENYRLAAGEIMLWIT